MITCYVVQMNITETPIELRLRHAQQSLAHSGVLDGAKDMRVTARIQRRLLDAARERSGLTGETELITAGLALLAAQDDFGTWLVTQRGTLSDDFETGL